MNHTASVYMAQARTFRARGDAWFTRTLVRWARNATRRGLGLPELPGYREMGNGCSPAPSRRVDEGCAPASVPVQGELF